MWQLVALGAYFLLGVVGIIDKILLSGVIKSPAALTFYTSTLALIIFVLAPFVGMSWHGGWQFVLATGAGFTFSLGILLYFRAAKKQEISRVVPGIAGFAPIFTLLLSTIFLGDTFSIQQSIAFMLLVVGGILITFEMRAKYILNFKNLLDIIVAAFVFSASFVLAKAVYIAQPFWSGFIWMRLGGGLFALLLLLDWGARKQIFAGAGHIPASGRNLFFVNQIIASGAFILQNFAFSLGPVALVNAFESTRHFFLLLLTVIMTKLYPKVLHERINIGTLFYKLAAIVCIMIGLFLMFQ